MNRFARNSLLLAAFALAGLGQSAQAGFIQQIQTVPTGNPPFSVPLTFNKFNTALGTLTAVTIIVDINGTLTSSVVNISPNPVAYTNAATIGTLAITGPDGTLASTALSTTPFSGTLAGSTYVPQQVGSITSSSSTTTNVASSGFAAFSGPGSTTFTIAAAGNFAFSGQSSIPNSVFFGGSATIGGSVEIDYTYTPAAIPEPASVVMMGLGLAGIVGFRRFRRRSA